MQFITNKVWEAIERLCRIQANGLLGQLVSDFSFRRRELRDHDPLAGVYVDLDAKEVGRAANCLLGIPADHAADLARDIMQTDTRRELAIEMIREVDRGDRPHQHTSVVKTMSEVDRANRHAAVHRNKTMRRASA